ncbi:MAG: tRNA(Met) cytidine acetyltransferase TmcA [Haloferacaceae archaeon]
MDLAGLAADLRAEARETNQRRLLVLAGGRDAGLDAASDALAAARDADDVDGVTVVSTREDVVRGGVRASVERIDPVRASRLLGTTRDAVVLDAHEGFSPNVLGQTTGVVDGGGLFVLLTPPLAAWPDRRDDFDERLAVPPYHVSDVTGRFRRRLVETIRTHPGVAVVDVDAGEVLADGLVGTRPAFDRSPPAEPDRHDFPREAYDACRTGDQSRALRELEALREPGSAVVVEADRGRGKSSAAGLAAGSLAAEEQSVLVTAPEYRSAAEVFARAADLLDRLGVATETDESAHRIETAGGGVVRFERPPTAAEQVAEADAVIVDEAAALPVALLESLLGARSVAFCTTVHGYEGAGRGFDVRFRERLAEGDRDVSEVRLRDPIRYAAGDPVEAWSFRALLLDARPAVAPLVADATPESVSYRALAPDDLLADEHLLREAFGLLVLAHYRTEPDDLARLLDAPNLRVRALCLDGHVVSVALLAREGGLDGATRRSMYDGSRVRGNMLPDVLTSQLRDEEAAVPFGFRVVRIATHHAARSRGLGSHLLDAVRDEVASGAEPDGRPAAGTLDCDADWLGVGYGATPRLLSFWRANGYRTVHLSTTRNETSGEYSALMLRPLSPAGRDLHDRHARWFADRVAGVLSDPLRDADPDVVRATLRATDADVDVSLTAHEWRVVVGAAYGPGLSDVAPAAFRPLVLAHLLGGGDGGERAAGDPEASLTAREERLLVRKVLQCHRWPAVADELDFVSTSACMRAFGEACKPLVDAYGDETALAERARYADE